MENLSTENVDNLCGPKVLWIMWKTYPQVLWISFGGEKIVSVVKILQLVHSDCG